MAEAKTKKGLISHGIAAQNRKARFDYAIKDTVEAGLVLKGPEVKSLRHGRATLSEAWAGERDGEMWLFNAYIPEYQGGVLSRFEPRAPRKLLLKRKQIRSLAGAVAREGVTLVPLQIHFNDRGRAKVLLGLGEGRKKQDKRAVIAERDWQRDKARLMRARGAEWRRQADRGQADDWAREGRLLTGTTADPERDRLPPGQRLVRDWPVLDLGAEPNVTPQKFRLDVDGAVENRLSLSLDEFMALPQSESVSDIHCVTQWSRYDNHWKGVAARALLEIVQPKPEARHVLFHSFDGYTTNVRLEQFDQPDVFLVHEWEGKPLSRAHGGPVRMLIPRLYFWKSAKWLRRIQFTISDHPGFWEQRGYHNNGDPWLEERYD